ncbi:MAG: FapA family protein [Eubacteriales bacterium]|nr:FapA family protein [Eubacteriales bacterium]
MKEILSEEMMKSSDGIIITFSEDDMEAYLCLQPNEKEYPVSLIKSRLKDMGITIGIRENTIRAMLEQKRYGQNVKIAEGIHPVPGVDGWYEFMFDTEHDDRPKILADGSVDYSMYGNIPSVEEEAVIAVYHPAQEAKDGVNIFGELLVATKGKNMAKLSGRGFTLLEDGCTYVAKYGGKITYDDGRLNIEQELLIKEDVSTSTGGITYRNDIHVRGNVLAGVSIVSEKGSIIVDGYVESASLSADKDVILKNGMQGNARGSIKAGGDVSGKFFERTRIDAGGNVNANAIMNSIVKAGNDVIVSGRFGIIIGGEIQANHQIKATIIGNTAEVENRIYAGVAGDLLAQLNHCEAQKKAAEDELSRIIQGMDMVDELLEKTEGEELKQKKLLLIRSKVEKDSQISKLDHQKKELVDLFGKANEAKITIDKMVYPGTVISVNGMKKNVTESENHVEYARRGPGIMVYHIEDV